MAQRTVLESVRTVNKLGLLWNGLALGAMSHTNSIIQYLGNSIMQETNIKNYLISDIGLHTRDLLTVDSSYNLLMRFYIGRTGTFLQWLHSLIK